MVKRLIALLMASIMSLGLLAGCSKETSNTRDDEEREERGEERGDNIRSGITTTPVNTKNFEEMMDAYKDYYKEFCEENLKPYYEDSSECDCAAKLVINPDNNKVMMAVADIVGVADEEFQVDLYFFEYNRGKVSEYLKIPNIWTTDDGIYVDNISDGLYVSNSSDSESSCTQYKISNGIAEEISSDTTSWIDIETESGTIQYPLNGTLSGRMMTDCDTNQIKFCVAERDFEDCLDYFKSNIPQSIADFKVKYGQFLIQNRVTKAPYIDVLVDDACYYYVFLENEKPYSYWIYDNRAGYPTNTGFFIPCVPRSMMWDPEYEFPEFPDYIDGYPVYQVKDEEIDVVISKYLFYFSSYSMSGSGLFIDINKDNVPECIVNRKLYYITPDGQMAQCSLSDGAVYIKSNEGKIAWTSSAGDVVLANMQDGMYHAEFVISPNGDGSFSKVDVNSGQSKEMSEADYDAYMKYLEENYIDVSSLDGWSSGIIGAWKKYNNQYGDYEFEEWCKRSLSDLVSDDVIIDLYGEDFLLYYKWLADNPDILGEMETNGCYIYASEDYDRPIVMYDLYYYINSNGGISSVSGGVLYIDDNGQVRKEEDEAARQCISEYIYMLNIADVSLGSLARHNLEGAWILYQEYEEQYEEYKEEYRASGYDIYLKYRDYFDSNNMSCSDCAFIDIDGNGTPELFLNDGIGDTLYYFDTDGNVDYWYSGYGGFGFIEGTGKVYSYHFMRADPEEMDYGFYIFKNGEFITEYSLHAEYYLDSGEWTREYYHDGISEDITEDQFNAYKDTSAYTSIYSYDVYSSLEEAWQAYIN